ncbi:MAG TPA: hypothetical protein P5244_09465 [Syntrophales bacterium]|nr:hypothetical protein [Syntrophales bacterium]
MGYAHHTPDGEFTQMPTEGMYYASDRALHRRANVFSLAAGRDIVTLLGNPQVNKRKPKNPQRLPFQFLCGTLIP